MALTEAHQGALTSGIFLGAEGLLLSAATVFFDAAHLGDPVGYQTGKRMAHCWSCGQEQGKQICAAGSHIDVAAKFCSKRKPHSQIRTRTPLQGASEDAKLPVKIAELTIDTYEKSPGDVGGKVDVVLLTKGRIHWLQRKPNCPDNQD